jgi:hypothetical protein
MELARVERDLKLAKEKRRWKFSLSVRNEMLNSENRERIPNKIIRFGCCWHCPHGLAFLTNLSAGEF